MGRGEAQGEGTGGVERGEAEGKGRGGEGRGGRGGEGIEGRLSAVVHPPQPKELSLDGEVVRGVVRCTLEGMEGHARLSTGPAALRATAHLSHLLLVLVKPALE